MGLTCLFWLYAPASGPHVAKSVKAKQHYVQAVDVLTDPILIAQSF